MFALTSYGEFVQSLKDQHRARLSEAIRGLAAGGTVEPIVIEGDPVAVLAEQSRALGLLVLGSRGYGPLRAVLAGRGLERSAQAGGLPDDRCPSWSPASDWITADRCSRRPLALAASARRDAAAWRRLARREADLLSGEHREGLPCEVALLVGFL